jgi:hypothetical protein
MVEWLTVNSAATLMTPHNTEGVIREMVEWHQTEQGDKVAGSRLKLGVLSGCGGDVHCGNSLETFTIHGWGYGLLHADLIEPFLLQFFALSAHAYTRGTWIAPESTPIDRTQGSPSFATPAGATAPILLKWLLVWEHPVTRTVLVFEQNVALEAARGSPACSLDVSRRVTNIMPRGHLCSYRLPP